MKSSLIELLVIVILGTFALEFFERVYGGDLTEWAAFVKIIRDMLVGFAVVYLLADQDKIKDKLDDMDKQEDDVDKITKALNKFVDKLDDTDSEEGGSSVNGDV